MKKLCHHPTLAHLTVLVLVLVLIASCKDDDDLCSSGIDIGYASCIVFRDNFNLDTKEDLITTVVRTTLENINEVMPTAGIHVIIQSAPNDAIPEIGIGGFNPNEEEVIISFDQNFPDIDQTIEEELPIQVAHEVHHAKRRRAVGYGSTLLEALVSEGLADCFAEEITGNSPSPWSVALDEEELNSWLINAKQIWNQSGYNHSNWFLGSSNEIPRWTGYAIGYKLAKDYIDQNPSRKASELYDEPASSFEQ